MQGGAWNPTNQLGGAEFETSAPIPDANSTGDYVAPNKDYSLLQYRNLLKDASPYFVAAGLSGSKETKDPITNKVTNYRNSIKITNDAVVATGDNSRKRSGLRTRPVGADIQDQIDMAAQYAQYTVVINGNPDLAATTAKYRGKSSTDADYAFLADGNSLEYANHLPGSDFIAGLPGALAVANWQPQRLMAPVMGVGLVGQRGGGALVYSNAPTVRKYCGDKNFLADRVQAQLALLETKKIGLSESSKGKVETMLRQLNATEQSLCGIYDQLDAYIGASGESGHAEDITGSKEPELRSIQSKLSELKTRKRKLAGQALSTIMTLEEVMIRAVGKALKAHDPKDESKKADDGSVTGASMASKFTSSFPTAAK
jgi:hypothetical protein